MKIVSLGVLELDRDLGGGVPHPSLISIEGEYGSGKTVFAHQMVNAMLKSGLRVFVVSSEATVKEYLSMMESVKLDAYDYYLSGQLNIYPLHVEGGRWSEFLSSFFLRVMANFLEIKKKHYDALFIDSLSVLTVQTPSHEFLTFVTRIKNLVSDGKTVVVTFHPEFMPEESIMKLRASSDVYLMLKNTSISGIDVKLLRIVKLWGVSGERKSSITLEINPQIGLRVMPLSGVKV
ncbi:MAG: ATPase domain-containing protein [Candidatus Bathyarchaeaceae archaeon]